MPGFGYTPEMQRASMSSSSAGVVQGSTYYLGFDALTHSELRIAGAAPKTAPPAWVDYLHVGGRLVGAFSTTCGASPCVKPGSGFNIAAMSHAAFGAGQLASVTSLTGSVAAASANPNGWGSLPAAIGSGPAGQYYDPWGARRTAVPAPAPPPGSIASSEHRGFIGEEHLDSVGLINLNRRLYDPHLGRFLGADPIAQGFFANPQGLNRYAYAGNTPLSASDPTGLDPFYHTLIHLGAFGPHLNSPDEVATDNPRESTAGTDESRREIELGEFRGGGGIPGVAIPGTNYAGGSAAVNNKQNQDEPNASHDRHHPNPLFMGGDPNQPLVNMDPADHQFLHSILNTFLHRSKYTDEYGNSMSPSQFNKGLDIQQNFSSQERQQAMADFYNKYGNLFPEARDGYFSQFPELNNRVVVPSIGNGGIPSLGTSEDN